MTPFIIFCLLQIADIYTTHRILSKGGKELNPFMASLFDAFGDHLAPLIAVKMLVCTLAFAFLIDWPYIIWALNAVYVPILINNFRQMKG